jgi:hypothetical protein
MKFMEEKDAAWWWNGFMSLVLIELILYFLHTIWAHDLTACIGTACVFAFSITIWLGCLMTATEGDK